MSNILYLTFKNIIEDICNFPYHLASIVKGLGKHQGLIFGFTQISISLFYNFRTSEHKYSSCFEESETRSINQPACPKKQLKQSKHCENISTDINLGTPLTLTRLRNRRTRMSNGIFSIFEAGDKQQACLEVFKNEDGKQYVHCAYFVSHDGMKITAFHPKEKILVSTKSPTLDFKTKNRLSVWAMKCSREETYLYTFEDLPKSDKKYYEYMKQCIDTVKKMTTKVTMYRDFGRFSMMENSPDPDYRMIFYKGPYVGYTIIEIGHETTIKDPNGRDVTKEVNVNDNFDLFDDFIKMKKQCKSMEETLNPRLFPVTLGRAPTRKMKYKDNITPITMKLSSIRGGMTEKEVVRDLEIPFEVK